MFLHAVLEGSDYSHSDLQHCGELSEPVKSACDFSV